jgi:hypothetical protein
MVSWKGSPGCKIKFKELHFYGRKVLDFAEQQSKTISQHKGQPVFRSSRGDRPTVRFECPQGFYFSIMMGFKTVSLLHFMVN